MNMQSLMGGGGLISPHLESRGAVAPHYYSNYDDSYCLKIISHELHMTVQCQCQMIEPPHNNKLRPQTCSYTLTGYKVTKISS